MESISLTSLASEKLVERHALHAVEDSVIMLTVLKSLPSAQ